MPVLRTKVGCLFLCVIKRFREEVCLLLLELSFIVLLVDKQKTFHATFRLNFFAHLFRTKV